MTIFERLKFLANKQGKSINRVEQDLNLPKNSLYSWKKAVPSGDRLELIADYFHVSVDYLLGREDKPLPSDDDLADMIERSTHFDGKEYPDEVKQGMKDVLRAYLMGRLDDKE
ncbi:MAG: helix-turn-helix domain-containing protein [Lactococcus lactis]